MKRPMNNLQATWLMSFFIALSLGACNSDGRSSDKADSSAISLNPKEMKHVGKVDERYQSYNIEMVEIVGGNFWIPYDKMDTTKQSAITDQQGVGENQNLYRTVPPINLYEKKLRTLAAALGPVYLRVSGTWANSVYFQDNDDPKMKTTPAGFKDVLTRAQWKGVVDFAKAVNAKLVTSFAINEGVRDKNGIWTPVQAQKLVAYTTSIGGEIAAAELFNEPTFAAYGGAPKGYDATTFAQDVAVFKNFAKSALPDMLVVGPGSVGEGGTLVSGDIPLLPTEDLLSAKPAPKFDIFSYHYYGAVSRRCKDSGPGTITPEESLSESWLGKTVTALDFYKGLRDKYNPDVPIWLTETADAACGGNPWGATYLDSFRYLEQLGRLAKGGVKVVMHNTLAASEYGLLGQDTHRPRPNYWAALLWSKLMGTEVFEAGEAVPGVNLYAHSMKNKPGGITVLVINTNDTASSIHIPMKAAQYTLTSKELQGKTVQLNGMDLQLDANDEIPAINGKAIKAGDLQLPPTSITFITFGDAGNKNME